MNPIHIAGPWITEKEVEYTSRAVREAWYEDANKYHDLFEKAFAQHIGVKYSVALPSCTSAIHLALMALGIGSGDEVILPDITWIASVAPVIYVGATPVFVDIDRQSWCLSVDATAKAITPRTKAIIAVDLYGNMPDMEGLTTLAREYDLFLLEDAAEAIGSKFKDKPAGGFGDVGVFSFHGSKTLTTGEGGMLLTNHEELFRRTLQLRDHGRNPQDKSFWSREVAHKYKMSSMQAALGLAQLERVEELVQKKRQIFNWYEKRLKTFPGLTLNQTPKHVAHSYWMTTAIVDSQYGIEKEGLIAQMRESEIHCRPFFYPLSSLPAFDQLEGVMAAKRANRVSYDISPYGFNLPSALTLTEDDVARTAEVLMRILTKAKP